MRVCGKAPAAIGDLDYLEACWREAFEYLKPLICFFTFRDHLFQSIDVPDDIKRGYLLGEPEATSAYGRAFLAQTDSDFQSAFNALRKIAEPAIERGLPKRLGEIVDYPFAWEIWELPPSGGERQRFLKSRSGEWFRLQVLEGNEPPVFGPDRVTYHLVWLAYRELRARVIELRREKDPDSVPTGLPMDRKSLEDLRDKLDVIIPREWDRLALIERIETERDEATLEQLKAEDREFARDRIPTSICDLACHHRFENGSDGPAGRIAHDARFMLEHRERARSASFRDSIEALMAIQRRVKRELNQLGTNTTDNGHAAIRETITASQAIALAASLGLNTNYATVGRWAKKGRYRDGTGKGYLIDKERYLADVKAEVLARAEKESRRSSH